MTVVLWLIANLAALIMSAWDLRDAVTVYRTAHDPPDFIRVTEADRQAVAKNLQMTGLRALLAGVFVVAGLVAAFLPAWSWTIAWFLIVGAFIIALKSWLSFQYRRRQHAQLRNSRRQGPL